MRHASVLLEQQSAVPVGWLIYLAGHPRKFSLACVLLCTAVAANLTCFVSHLPPAGVFYGNKIRIRRVSVHNPDGGQGRARERGSHEQLPRKSKGGVQAGDLQRLHRPYERISRQHVRLSEGLLCKYTAVTRAVMYGDIIFLFVLNFSFFSVSQLHFQPCGGLKRKRREIISLAKSRLSSDFYVARVVRECSGFPSQHTAARHRCPHPTSCMI